ncbi:hypothetical protein Dsin_022187 [Dipteronia sinensis]|uniref:Uncharacterized protein n=1 Tax=Dipteronia sinensis TaxID=43782 RepID=A0AAE0A1Z5_9ROSI|nr:hypothetical protein Dsin_022187 [Dipteronia sinensis]
MHCGKSVLTPNYPSIVGTVVVNEELGYTFSPNVKSFAKALEVAIRDGPIVLQRKGVACKQHTVSMFTATKMASAYERFFLCMKNTIYCQEMILEQNTLSANITQNRWEGRASELATSIDNMTTRTNCRFNFDKPAICIHYNNYEKESSLLYKKNPPYILTKKHNIVNDRRLKWNWKVLSH